MNGHDGVASGTAGPGERTGYILDMLLQLAAMALNNGEEALASDIVQTIEFHAARTTQDPAPIAAGVRIGVSRA